MSVGSASYRDPENVAVPLGGRWYRVAAPDSASVLTELRGSDVYECLVSEGAIASFCDADPETAQAVIQSYRRASGRDPSSGSRVFEVEMIDVVTYPWEWPNHLLKQAGLLTLSLREKFLEVGLDLKDASALNIQFRGMQPVLMDLGSVERWRPNPSWNAARQYVEHFINPLAVGSADHVAAADAWELSHHGGLLSEVARTVMPRRLRRRPSLWALQASIRPRADHAPVESKYSEQAKQNHELALRATRSLTRRLRKQTMAVSGGEHSSTWHDYGKREHYAEEDLQRKLEFSRAFVGHEDRGGLVLDIGGNDGLVALDLARGAAERTLVLDADAGALDVLSHRIAGTPELQGRITPLYADVTNLAPASGLLYREFAAFTDRIKPTAILCQAVLHHMVITQGVPMALAVEALAKFGAPVLVEFATEDDPKVQILLSQIPNWKGEYSTRVLLDDLGRSFTNVALAGRTAPTRVVVTTGPPRN